MPTFQDPTADATEASEALRGLAHATRALDGPADSYAVIGNLLAGVRSLRQVIDQLAAAHLDHRARAHDDNGNHLAGAHEAFAAANELHQAGTLLDAVVWRLDAACQDSGPPPAAGAASRLASRLDGFGDPLVRNDSRPDPRSRGLSR